MDEPDFISRNVFEVRYDKLMDRIEELSEKLDKVIREGLGSDKDFSSMEVFLALLTLVRSQFVTLSCDASDKCCEAAAGAVSSASSEMRSWIQEGFDRAFDLLEKAGFSDDSRLIFAVMLAVLERMISISTATIEAPEPD